MSLPLNQVLYGDCIQVLKEFPENNVDCVVTDPPYGIGFMGKEWDKALPPKEAFREMFRVLKPGALAFVMSSPRQDVLWRMLRMLEGCGFQLRQSFVSWIYKSGFPKAYDVSKGIDKKFGTYRKGEPLSTTRSSGASPSGCYGEGVQKKYSHEPTSDLAKKWQGWKSVTGLKPALECVLMVNKPLRERTIVDNVLKHGTGAINVDACRIPFEQTDDIHAKNPHTTHNEETTYECYSKRKTAVYKIPQGRFPANLLVSDKALDTGKTSKSEAKLPHHQMRHPNYGIYGRYAQNDGYYYPEDVGDQSRYFDLDAWARHHGFLDVAKASKSERNKGLVGFEEKPAYNYGSIKKSVGRHGQNTPRKNIHPTVKPVKLGAYLTTLGCPPDGVMLDPFCGTGSFLIGAHTVGRQWIGIDNKAEYVEISKYRIGAYSQKLTEWTP